jgi:hypothetical protein
MAIDGIMSLIWEQADRLVAGAVGGIIGVGLKETFQYLWGWYRAGRFESADVHIAATMYPRIDPADPGHGRYLEALEDGKTHVQELLWLGSEVSLKEFLDNAYVLRQANAAMSRARNAGLLLGDMPERAERPLLKKLVGFHNAIPANDIVRVFKTHVGTDGVGRVHGISPPTHEHYPGSPHRRVLRAMFVADSQLANGLPHKTLVHFPRGIHADRYDTLSFLIDEYKVNPERFEGCRVYF